MGAQPLRIQVVSGLHAKATLVQPRLAPGADLLVVAGGTCEDVKDRSDPGRRSPAWVWRCGLT